VALGARRIIMEQAAAVRQRESGRRVSHPTRPWPRGS